MNSIKTGNFKTKKIILYLIIILCFCNCKKENTDLSTEEISEINAIVEAVLIQDSLHVFSKSKDSKMFCSELTKLSIYIPEKRNDGLSLPPPPRGVLITELLKTKINGEVFFSSKDSSYILSQKSNPEIPDGEKLEIEKNLVNRLNSTTIEKKMTKRKNKELCRFYEMTIPVFSIDRQKAYVQLDYHCGGRCGDGKALYLKKTHGKWKIVQKWRTWMS